MRNNWKKWLLSVLIVVLAFSMIGYAAGKPGTYAKKIKITWVPYSIQPTDPNGEILKWLEAKFNVDIDVWNFDESKFNELLSLRMAAGEIPDFYRTQKLCNLVDQGVVGVIPNGVFKKYAPNIYKVLHDNTPHLINSGVLNGKMYGIPSVNALNIFRIPLVYREDWMKKVGVTKTPDTLAEFETLMTKFAKEDPDGNGKNDTYGFSYRGVAAVCGAFGVPVNRRNKDDYFVKQGKKIIKAAVAPELKAALAVLRKLYKAGVMDPEFVTGENYGGYANLSHAFINSRIGFTTMGNYYHWIKPGDYSVTAKDGKKIPCDPGANAAEMQKVNPAAKWTFGMPLQGPTGKRGIFQFNQLQYFYAFGKPVEKDQEKLQRILQIFDFTSGNPDIEIRRTASLGVKGKHWEWIDKEHEEVDKLSPYDKQSGYNDVIGACLRADMPFPLKSFREQWAYQHQFDKYGMESLIQGSLPITQKYSAELIKIRDEAIIDFITGDRPLDQFDQYVKQYMSAGGAEVEKEANDYYKNAKKR